MISVVRKSLIVIYTSMMLYSGIAVAETFPPKTDAIVQDDEKVMDPSQVQQLSEIVGKLPEQYKIIIIPATEELTTKEYANQLFTEYGFKEQQMLLVFNQDKQELAVKAGTFFTNKGLTDEVITQTVEHFFVPYAKQKSYMSGISTTVQHLSDITQNGLPSAKGEASEVKPASSEEESSSSWLYLFVVSLVAVFGGGIYVHFLRKKYNQEMDELEDWMDKIENKLKQLGEDPISKVKGNSNPISNLIQRVRKDSLPSAEFSLLEAEAMCDRFRFQKAAYHIQKTKDLLAHIDNEISQVQSKMFQSKIAEEECERLVEEISKSCQLLEKKLDEARLQHGVTFYELRELLEQSENWLKAMPKEIENDPNSFLEQLKEKKQSLIDGLKEIEGFPKLKQEVAVTLEKELLQLQDGFQEMMDGGYQIPMEQFDDHVERMRQEVTSLQQLLEEGRIDGVTGRVQELREQIDSIYDLMEEIVTKKAMLDYYFEEIPQMLATLDQERQQLKEELEELALRYRVQEGAIFNYYLDLEKVCHEVSEQLFLAKQMDTGNDLELIQAADILEAVQKQIEQLIQQREEAYLELEELRKGEIEAQDTVMQLHAEIIRIEQQIRRRNLPGIPSHLTSMIEEGKKALFEIEMALNQIPLELHRINHLVKEAKEFTEQLLTDTDAMFKLSQMAEEKIQLTNRYRSQWKEVNEILTEAETAFRNAQYELSFDLAEQAHQMGLSLSDGRTKINLRKKKG